MRNLNTLDNIEQLAEESLITEQLARQLSSAYQFLRRAEDALQMLNNQQTHTTPNALHERQAWLALLNTQEDIFNRQLSDYREIVYAEFNQLFNDGQSETEQSTSFDDSSFKQQLNERSLNILNDWEQGFLIYGALPSQASQLTALSAQLLNTVYSADIDPDIAINKIDSYLRQLPAGGQYLILLQKQPQLIEKLIKPLLLSSGMATLLEQSPHIIDSFLEQRHQDLKPCLDRDYILKEKDHEQALEKFRRMTNEELYRQYLFYLENKITSCQLQDHLTEQAETTLQLALDLSYQYLGIKDSCLSIIGLGKLGMQAMMPLSDIDLMYLFDHSIDVQTANKIASQLNTILHTRMREGRVYEIDTRLRPSGRSGSPTISIKSFEHYHQHQAFNWEHLALFPARVVCGNQITGEKFDAVKKHSLSKMRNLQQWRLDAFKMFQRISEQRIHKDNGFIFSAKLRDGGLMQAEYLLACHAIEQAQLDPDILNYEYLQVIDSIPRLANTNFKSTLIFWRNLQIAIRLFGHENTDIEQLPAYIQDILLRHLDISSLAQLNQQIQTHAQTIQSLSSDYFSAIDRSQIKEWKEKPIQWQ